MLTVQVNGRRWKNSNNIPLLEAKKDEPLIILALGPSYIDDLKKINVTSYDVMGINDAIEHYPEDMHHAVSWHIETLSKWYEQRKAKGYNAGLRLHSRKNTKWCEFWDVLPKNGSSAFLGVMIGLSLGYPKIHLVGIPMVDGLYPPGYTGEGRVSPIWRHTWEAMEPWFKGRVFSYSGWTRELLGEPV